MGEISWDELYNISYELIMQDLRPFATSIGINEERLDQYKRDCNQTGQGTVRLLEKVATVTDNPDRRRVYRALKYSGYCKIAQMVIAANYASE